VCQRHSRAIKDLGLASAFFLMEQVSQAKVFSEDGVWSVFMFFSLLFLIRMLGGRTATGNRDQGQVEIADSLEQPVECGLVEQQAGKQGLIPFQVRQLQACKPIRPAWIQMAPDFDLVVFRQSSPPRLVSGYSIARGEEARICQTGYSGVYLQGLCVNPFTLLVHKIYLQGCVWEF
jgi:hypothetical protein